MVSLFSHIVLASIYQSVDFSFALLLIILQKETKSQTGQPIEDRFRVKSFGRHQSEANKELFFKTFTRIQSKMCSAESSNDDLAIRFHSGKGIFTFHYTGVGCRGKCFCVLCQGILRTDWGDWRRFGKLTILQK